MRIDLNLNPVVGGKVRVMCKSYRQATKKKAKLERAYPDSCYLIGQDTIPSFIYLYISFVFVVFTRFFGFPFGGTTPFLHHFLI